MKKINTKTSKKIVAVILAAVAAFSIVGCSVKTDFKSTETETVVDADGNETTTTTTNDNGVVTTETTTNTAEETEEAAELAVYEDVSIEFSNEMGWDIAGFYLKMSSSDEWTDNYLEADQYIDNGVTMSGINVTYDEEDRFLDVLAVDVDGNEVEFDGIELPAEGSDQIVITFGVDEAGDGFTATVE